MMVGEGHSTNRANADANRSRHSASRARAGGLPANPGFVRSKKKNDDRPEPTDDMVGAGKTKTTDDGGGDDDSKFLWVPEGAPVPEGYVPSKGPQGQDHDERSAADPDPIWQSSLGPADSTAAQDKEDDG